jgi:N-acetylglutamate synthase-like GNAT family acetyltransferase
MGIESRIRRATLDDCPALDALIARSIRQLGLGDYTTDQIEAALKGAFGVDTQLIRDGSYYVCESADRIIGCGGWSRRRTLFGGDALVQRDASELDPAVDAGRIRAFFVDPDMARQGIGSQLLERCEADAFSHGFRRLELMATLPGVRLYAARGYEGNEQVSFPMTPELSIEFVPMIKHLSP